MRRDEARLASARSGAEPLLKSLHYNPTSTSAVASSDTKEDSAAAPKSFVVRHGKVGKNLQSLVMDFRRVFLPNTAINLRERNKATMKDYVHVAGPLGVTHVVAVSQSKQGPAMKISRLPTGPTLTFRIMRYTLPKQVRAAQRKAFDASAAFKNSPLVVLNNFDAAGAEQRHVKITGLTIQAMFPPINVQSVKLSECTRVVLFHYDQALDVTEFRHYAIRVKARGASKPVKKILRPKIPNLGHADDISETLLGNALAGYATSDSEVDEEGIIDLPKRRLPGRRKKREEGTSQNAVKLVEIGPRLSLKLIKIEDSVFSGEVQYHAYQERSKEEVRSMRKRHRERAELKEQRKTQQEENVKRKRQEKEHKLQAKRQRKQAFLAKATEASSKP